MLKTFYKVFYLGLILISVNALAEYERPLVWSGNIYKIIDKFTKEHKKFSKFSCKPGDVAKYHQLIKRYRGQGYYLPKLGTDIDRKSIIKNLHHYKKKIKFLDGTIERLRKQKDFTAFSLIQSEIDKIVSNLLNLKKRNHQAVRTIDKNKTLLESRVELKLLKKQIEIFMDQVFFLKSYRFPNDYLASRREYEKYKDLEGTKNKKKANEIFFYRKIIEDGAYDPNRTRPDKFIRTALDTLYLKIKKEKDFLSEGVRYDLEWIERKVESILKRGKKIQLLRLEEWKKRTESNFKFYQDLVAIKNKKKAKFLVQKENEASFQLKEFVYKKQADAYEYWSTQSEISKALFSLETILVHEVGVIDGQHGLERTTVGKVVLNRFHDDFYNKLEDDQEIVKYINKDIDTDSQKWLNVLFKVGEFSFTYHYIPAVTGIFCPDMSRRGQGIRKKNLKIALKVMKSHDGSFNAFRYFSRISMLGKIDMSSVWTDYVHLPEMPGYKSLLQRNLVSHYYADKYQFLYTFFDERNIEHFVVKIKKRVYSMRWLKGVPVFYDYRNPHLFAYFSKQI